MEPRPEICQYCGYSTPWYCLTDEDAKTCRTTDRLNNMSKPDDLNDFGFSIVTEEQVASSHINATKEDCQRDLVALRDMIMPLLKNLAKPGGTTIYWPDREKKVNEFIKKMNTLVDTALKK